MSDDLKKALGDASTTFHKIAMALTARRFLAEKPNLTPPLRAKLEKDLLTDEAIEKLCATGFEDAVRALGAAGDPSVTIFECGKKDIPE